MSESENNKRQQNTWLEKVGIIMPFISVVVDAIFGILSLQFGKINLIIFILFPIVLLAIWIGLTASFVKKINFKKTRYECKKDEFIQRFIEDTDEEYVRSMIEKNEDKYTIRRKGDIKCYIVITAMLGVGIVVAGGMIAGQLKALSATEEKDESDIGIRASSNENTTTVENTIYNEGNGYKGITPEEKKEMENKTFILNDPERLRILSKEDEERVFYVTMDQEKMEEEVNEHVKSIYNQKKRSSFLENSTEARIAASIQKEEDIFLYAIDEAMNYRTQENYEVWKSVIPNSNTLESIMNNREILLTPPDEDMQDMEFDGVLYIRSANNNQLLADEYKHQEGKPETVVYYYVEAIKRTEDGLAYEDIPQEYKKIYYNYLKARYKDIADYIESNLERFGAEKERYQQIKEKAYAIYEAM